MRVFESMELAYPPLRMGHTHDSLDAVFGHLDATFRIEIDYGMLDWGSREGTRNPQEG